MKSRNDSHENETRPKSRKSCRRAGGSAGDRLDRGRGRLGRLDVGHGRGFAGRATRCRWRRATEENSAAARQGAVGARRRSASASAVRKSSRREIFCGGLATVGKNRRAASSRRAHGASRAPRNLRKVRTTTWTSVQIYSVLRSTPQRGQRWRGRRHPLTLHSCSRRSCARARANRCASCSRGRSARSQLVPPFEEALRRRTGRHANGADAALAGRLVPDGGLRTHDELSLEFHADGATIEGTLRRRGTDGELHPYSTWTVEDAAGWEALQNCYLDSGCGDAGRRQQLVARLPALLAAAPAAAAPAVTAAAPPAAASAPSDGGDLEVMGTSVRSVRLGFGLRLTVYSLELCLDRRAADLLLPAYEAAGRQIDEQATPPPECARCARARRTHTRTHPRRVPAELVAASTGPPRMQNDRTPHQHSSLRFPAPSSPGPRARREPHNCARVPPRRPATHPSRPPRAACRAAPHPTSRRVRRCTARCRARARRRCSRSASRATCRRRASSPPSSARAPQTRGGRASG